MTYPILIIIYADSYFVENYYGLTNSNPIRRIILHSKLILVWQTAFPKSLMGFDSKFKDYKRKGLLSQTLIISTNSMYIFCMLFVQSAYDIMSREYNVNAIGTFLPSLDLSLVKISKRSERRTS